MGVRCKEPTGQQHVVLRGSCHVDAATRADRAQNAPGNEVGHAAAAALVREQRGGVESASGAAAHRAAAVRDGDDGVARDARVVKHQACMEAVECQLMQQYQGWQYPR